MPAIARPFHVAIALLLSLALGACAAEEGGPPPAPAVKVVTVQEEPFRRVTELPGRVQAIRTAEVRARVDGIVQKRLFREGTDVSAGQPLFAIDPRELRANLSAYEASLARARANAANARQDVNRYKPLLADQAISKQEYDAAVARLGSAEADVAQAQAQVEGARLSLGYTTVTAPISGRAGRARVTEGALVSAGQGTLLATIEQLNPIYVNFSQSSSDLLAIRRAMAARGMPLQDISRVEVDLLFEDGTPYGIIGHLDFLDLTIDEATGTAALRAEFDNPARLLLPGQFVRARIRSSVREMAIKVPQRAVRIAQEGASVMVVGPDSMAQLRPVTLGQLEGGKWIIRSGLKPGEQVIVSGLQMARPGQPVRIAPDGGNASPVQPAPATGKAG